MAMLIALLQCLLVFQECFKIARIQAVNLAVSAILIWMVSRPFAMAATEHFLQAGLKRLKPVRPQFFLHFINVETLMVVTVHRNGSDSEAVRKRVYGSKD